MIRNFNVEAVTMDLISGVGNSGSRKSELNLDLCLAPPNTHKNPDTVPNPNITAPSPLAARVVIRAPPAPVVTNLSCPICIGPFTEEMATKCGHIFCRGCIMRSLAVKSACPTCRKKVTKRGLIRVFLPVPSSP